MHDTYVVQWYDTEQGWKSILPSRGTLPFVRGWFDAVHALAPDIEYRILNPVGEVVGDSQASREGH